MITPTEHQEQAALIRWANLQSCTIPELSLLFAVPNGANKSPSARKSFKAEGLKSGVPDLILPVARGEYHHLYIEMKRKSPKGYPSKDQKGWLRKLTEQGNRAVVCWGFEEAKEEILNYLQLSLKYS